MFGYVEMHNAPAIVSQHYQNEQNSKGGSGDNEEVDGDQVFDMIVQESASRLGRRIISPRHPSGNRPFRDSDTKFAQFTMDSGAPPSRIRIGHCADKIADFFSDPGATGRTTS